MAGGANLVPPAFFFCWGSILMQACSKPRVGLVCLFLFIQFVAAVGLIANRGIYHFVSEADATPLVDTVAVSGSCSDTPVTAFAPGMAYSLSFTAPSQSGPPTCSATMSLTGPVNGDTAPSLGCSISDVSGGYAVMSGRMPTIKIGGLVCQTQDRVQLEVYGDGSDYLPMDIAISTVGSTAWDASKKVDASTSSSKIMLFGSGGQVGTSAIIDGQDNDGLTNGEVAFGGTVASQGGSRIYVKEQFYGNVPQASTDRETLTFSFTPQ